MVDPTPLRPRSGTAEAPSCPFCHPARKCHSMGFDLYSCPRVEAIAFLNYEDSYPDWPVSAVTFRSSEEEYLLAEIQIEEDEDAG